MPGQPSKKSHKHSAEAILRRKAQKKKKDRLLVCDIPVTNVDRKRWKQLELKRYVYYPLHMKDLRGATFVKYIPLIIPEGMLHELCESTMQLQAELPPKIDATCRGKQ